MTGTILAGGENRRIPLLKGHIEIDGERIVDRNIKLLLKFFDKVIISTNNPELYFYCGMPMIGDILKQRGPLSGIYSVIINMQEDALFVIACDMPFVKPELISLLITRYASYEKNCDAVIPVFEGRPQPLLGIYSRNIRGILEKMLKKGDASVRDMLTALKVSYIKEDDVRAIDPEGMSFVNINTIEDYEKVRGGNICLV